MQQKLKRMVNVSRLRLVDLGVLCCLFFMLHFSLVVHGVLRHSEAVVVMDPPHVLQNVTITLPATVYSDLHLKIH